MSKTCILCNNKECWLNSMYCYECSCKITQKENSHVYSGVNQEYEYRLTERTMKVSNGVSKRKKKKVIKRLTHKEALEYNEFTVTPRLPKGAGPVQKHILKIMNSEIILHVNVDRKKAYFLGKSDSNLLNRLQSIFKNATFKYIGDEKKTIN